MALTVQRNVLNHVREQSRSEQPVDPLDASILIQAYDHRGELLRRVCDALDGIPFDKHVHADALVKIGRALSDVRSELDG